MREMCPYLKPFHKIRVENVALEVRPRDLVCMLWPGALEFSEPFLFYFCFSEDNGKEKWVALGCRPHSREWRRNGLLTQLLSVLISGILHNIFKILFYFLLKLSFTVQLKGEHLNGSTFFPINFLYFISKRSY